MTEGLSLVRLYLLRLMYLLNFVLLGWNVWPAIIYHKGALDPLPGVAFSFWAALSTLSGLGILYPIAMLPLLFLQLFYKVVWLLAVGLPLRFTGPAAEMSIEFAVGVLLNLIVIPWPYVWTRYVRGHGDRWM